MKKIFWSVFLAISIISCVKDDMPEVNSVTNEIANKFLSKNLNPSISSYQRISIGKEAFVSFIDIKIKGNNIVRGEHLIKGTVLEYEGKKYFNIVQFTSELKVSDEQLKVVIINSYKHALKISSQTNNDVTGLLMYSTLDEEVFQAEYVKNGMFEMPVSLVSDTKTRIKPSSEILNRRRKQINNKSQELLMDGSEGCTDWYYIETWRNAEGQVIMMKETYLFTTGCPITGGGSQGASGGSSAEETNNNSSGKLVCPETFQFKNTASNWQAAYVKNYKYAFMGSDRMGNPANYYICMDFEIGVGINLTTAENAQRIATRALNIAERKVADKITSGYYTGQGARAPLLLQRDLKNIMITYFNRQLGLVDGSSATTINQGRVTANESDGVDAVFVGWFGC